MLVGSDRSWKTAASSGVALVQIGYTGNRRNFWQDIDENLLANAKVAQA